LIFGFFAGYITRKNSEKSQYIERYKKDNDKFYRAIERQFDLNDSIFLPFLLTKGSIADYGDDAVEVFCGDTKLKIKESGVEITGDLTISGEATIGGIPFSTHIHPYLNVAVPSTTGTPEV